jgi:hypothetical protein
MDEVYDVSALVHPHNLQLGVVGGGEAAVYFDIVQITSLFLNIFVSV